MIIAIVLLLFGIIIFFLYNKYIVGEKIGEYMVKPKQIIAGNNLATSLLNGQNCILKAEPQSGKTGAQIWAVKKILENCNPNVRIIYILHASNNKLKSQSLDDFKRAFTKGIGVFSYEKLFNEIDPIIQVKHRSDFNDKATISAKLQLNNNNTYYTFFDEVHEALPQDGIIDSIYKSLNEYTTVYSLCSATPYPQELLAAVLESQGKRNEFETTVLKPGIGYYGIIDYHNDNRYKQGDSLFDGNNLSRFSHNWIHDFMDKCKKYGNGYGLIRINQDITSKQKELLRKYIDDEYHEKCDFKEFNSLAPNENLDELDDFLSSETKVPCFVIIKQALRLGERITNKDHTRIVLDTPEASSTASAAQSLAGRYASYQNGLIQTIIWKCKRIFGKHSKFNIYCDRNEIKKYLSQKENEILSSNWNRSNKKEMVQCEWKWFSSKEDAIKYAESLGVKWDTKTTPNGSCSKNLAISVADRILNGSSVSSHSPIIHIDGPSTSKMFNGSDDYQKLIVKYPDIVNSYAVGVAVKNIVTLDPNYGHYRSGVSAFYNREPIVVQSKIELAPFSGNLNITAEFDKKIAKDFVVYVKNGHEFLHHKNNICKDIKKDKNNGFQLNALILRSMYGRTKISLNRCIQIGVEVINQ